MNVYNAIDEYYICEWGLLKESALLESVNFKAMVSTFVKLYKMFVKLLKVAIPIAGSYGVFNTMYLSSKAYFSYLSGCQTLAAIFNKLTVIASKGGYYAMKAVNILLHKFTGFAYAQYGSGDLATKIGLKLTQWSAKSVQGWDNLAQWATYGAKTGTVKHGVYKGLSKGALGVSKYKGGAVAKGMVSGSPHLIQSIAAKMGYFLGGISAKISALIKAMLISHGVATSTAISITPVVTGIIGVAAFLIIYVILKKALKFAIRVVKGQIDKIKANIMAKQLAKQSIQLQKQAIARAQNEDKTELYEKIKYKEARLNQSS